MASRVPLFLHRALAGALSVVACFAPAIFADEPPAATPPASALPDAPALFQHIVLLGASVTAGFEITEPLGGPKTPQFRFVNFIEGALAGAHQPVETQATPLLFLNAEETMGKQVAATVAAKPSLVIGVDALFWFCYGAGMTPDQRRARFETGLRLLDRIAAPLVLGDLPDASPAVGEILSKTEMPDPTVLAQCNERLKAWAAERKNVTLIPLSRMMAAAYAHTEVTLGGQTWTGEQAGGLIRADNLHPSRHALAALAIEALDTAAKAGTPPAPDCLCHEVQTVWTRALARSGVVPSEAK